MRAVILISTKQKLVSRFRPRKPRSLPARPRESTLARPSPRCSKGSARAPQRRMGPKSGAATFAMARRRAAATDLARTSPAAPRRQQIKMAKLALALSPPRPSPSGPRPTGASRSSSRATSASTPGRSPRGLHVEDTEGLPAAAPSIKHGRISMMAFLGMMVQELGITFPGSMTLDGSVQFSDILKDGMGRGAANASTFASPDHPLRRHAETVAMPASQYTAPAEPPGRPTARRADPGGYPPPSRSRTPRRTRASRRLQNGRAAMMGVRRRVPLQVDCATTTSSTRSRTTGVVVGRRPSRPLPGGGARRSFV